MKRSSFSQRHRCSLIGIALATTTFFMASSADASLTGVAAGTKSVTLHWLAPGDDGDAGTATQYDIRYSTQMITSANWDLATQVTGEPTPQPAGSQESFTITGLQPSTTYYFAIKAADEVPNWSPLSNVISVTTAAEATPPATVTNLATSAVTATTVVLNWTAPGDDSVTGTASQYDIRYSTVPITASNWAAATQVTGEPAPQPSGSAETFTVTGLQSAATYYFALETADEVPNWSGLSNVVSVTTGTETTPPWTVSDLTVTGSTDSSVSLSWTAPGDDSLTGTASQYDLRYSTVPITTSNWGSATQVTGEPAPKPSGSTETFAVTGLNGGTLYYFALKTADEVPNWSGLSNVVSQATVDNIPPAAINDLQASTGTANGTIDLSWTAPGNDGLFGRAAFYEIRYGLQPLTDSNWSNNTLVTAPPTPSPSGTLEIYTLRDLTPGQQYHVALRAGDSVLNMSSLSNVVTATAGLNIATGTNDVTLEAAGPSDGARLHATRPVLSVRNVRPDLVDLYLFELATDSNFFNLVASDQVIEEPGSVTSWRIPVPLDPSKTYCWRAKTEGSVYTATSTFSVDPQPRAYPNPFVVGRDGQTVITDLPAGEDVTLVSASGRVIRHWVRVSSGEISWDGTNEAGDRIASGLYLWFVGNTNVRGKVVVVR